MKEPADFRSFITGLAFGIAIGAGFVVSFFVLGPP